MEIEMSLFVGFRKIMLQFSTARSSRACGKSDKLQSDLMDTSNKRQKIGCPTF